MTVDLPEVVASDVAHGWIETDFRLVVGVLAVACLALLPAKRAESACRGQGRVWLDRA